MMPSHQPRLTQCSAQSTPFRHGCRRWFVVVVALSVLILRDARGEGEGENVKPKTYTYKRVGDLAIKADVFRFPGDEVRPAIIWIHGGGLITGGRGGPSQEERKRFLDAGLVIVSIDYRLAPETKAAGIVEDVRGAIAWVRTEGPKLYKIDPQRVVVAGSSAGGYLALVVGFAVEPRPQALIAISGYGDVDGDWYAKPHEIYCKTRPMFSKEEAYVAIGTKATTTSGKGRSNFYTYCRQHGLWPKEVVGFDPLTQPREFDRFCPVRNVTANYPPTLLVHGDKDIDVPYEQSVAMAAELKRAGVAHEFITLKGGGHGFGGKTLKDPDVSAVFDRIEQFLKTHVGKDARSEGSGRRADEAGKSDLPRDQLLFCNSASCVNALDVKMQDGAACGFSLPSETLSSFPLIMKSLSSHRLERCAFWPEERPH